MYYDALLHAETEAGMQDLVPDLWTEDEDGNRHWKAHCVPNIKVVLKDAVYDEDGEVVEPAETVPGWFLWVSTREFDEGLRNLPDNACRIIADRGAYKAGKEFLVYVAPDMDTEIFETAKLRPIVAGADYPFGEIAA